jgi:hypothetical protein
MDRVHNDIARAVRREDRSDFRSFLKEISFLIDNVPKEKNLRVLYNE